MNMGINGLSELQKNDIESNITRFRNLINNLVGKTKRLTTKIKYKTDLIIKTVLLNEKLMIEGYEIIGFGDFKELPNGDYVLKINVKGHSKTDTLYLTNEFKIFKTESGRLIFHIGQIVDVIKKRTGEKTGIGTGIIIENGIGSSPVLLVCKQGIMLNTYPQINPFIGEK